MDWTAIQIEYESGAKPQKLAEKYNCTAKEISNKAYQNGWKINKEKLDKKKIEKSRKNREEKIARNATKAIDIIKKVMDNENAKDSDRLKAADMALALAGLNVQKQETNVNIQPYKEVSKEKLKEIYNEDIFD